MKFSTYKVAKQQLSTMNHTAVEARAMPVSKKPEPSMVNPINEFDWGLLVNKSGSKGQNDRSGINLVVSSSYGKNREKGKITMSFSDGLLAKMRWRIGDKAAVGFARRNNQVVVGIKLDPNGRVISAQTGSKTEQSKIGILYIPRLDTLPILPVKYTRLEESDFDFSTPGVFVFTYPQNAEVNAG